RRRLLTVPAMSPSILLRPPLCWLVLAEIVIMAALGVVTWRAWDPRQPPQPVPAVPPRAVAPSPHGAQSRRASPAPSAAPASPAPAVSSPPDLVSRDMSELNRVAAALEDVEWRTIRATVDGIQYYLD